MQLPALNLKNAVDVEAGKNAPADTEKARLVKKIRAKAEEFETVFIAEMLQFAQIGMPKTEGASEIGAFEGFMREAYAEAIVKRGGFGLADQVAKHLLRAELGSETAARNELSKVEQSLKEKNFLNTLEGERSYGRTNGA